MDYELQSKLGQIENITGLHGERITIKNAFTETQYRLGILNEDENIFIFDRNAPINIGDTLVFASTGEHFKIEDIEAKFHNKSEVFCFYAFCSYVRPQSIKHITKITQGHGGNVIIGNHNSISGNISNILVDIKASSLDDIHKTMLTEIFSEYAKTNSKTTFLNKVEKFIYEATTGAVSDSAKSALVFLISKLIGV